MRLPHFSIKDLIIAVTMTGLGLGLLSMVNGGWLVEHGLLQLALYLGGAAITGAGLLYPLSPIDGAFVGSILAILNGLFELFPIR
jgi:hypothetical protein